MTIFHRLSRVTLYEKKKALQFETKITRIEGRSTRASYMSNPYAGSHYLLLFILKEKEYHASQIGPKTFNFINKHAGSNATFGWT